MPQSNDSTCSVNHLAMIRRFQALLKFEREARRDGGSRETG